MAGAGEDMQLGGDAGPHQPQRVVDRLVAQRIELRAGDQRACNTGQLIGASRHGVGRHRFACQVVLPHLRHRRPVEPRGRGELVLRRRRAIVEHRLVQQLEHNRRCRSRRRRAERAAPPALRRRCCPRPPAGRCRCPGSSHCRLPTSSTAAASSSAGRIGIFRAPTGSRRRSPCSGRVARTPRTGGDRCRDCPARKPLRGNRSPLARAPVRRGRCAPESTAPRGSRSRRRRC